MWRKKELTHCHQRAIVTQSSLFQIFWLPKAKLYTLQPLKHFVKNSAKPVEAPPLVTSYCHRQADFSTGVLFWSQSFGWWFYSIFHILLFYMLKKLPCPVGYDSGHGLTVLLSESERLRPFPTATAVIINHQVNITFEAFYTCCSLSRLCPFGIQHQSVS